MNFFIPLKLSIFNAFNITLLLILLFWKKENVTQTEQEITAKAPLPSP